jgi:hypothetical protein
LGLSHNGARPLEFPARAGSEQAFKVTQMKRSIGLSTLLSLLVLALLAAALEPLAVNAAPARTLAGDLVSYWKLDETTGNRLDTVGAQTLTVNGSVSYQSGKVSNAVLFNGNSYLLHGSNSTLQTGDIDYSVSAWVYLTALPANGVAAPIVSKTADGAGEYSLKAQTTAGLTHFRFTVTKSDGTGLQTAQKADVNVQTGTWYFLVGWHDATNNTVGISVDDVTQTATYSSGVSAVSAAQLNIGTEDIGPHEYLTGAVDEVGFWKRLLTEDEKTTLYNGGYGCVYPFTSCSVTQGTTIALYSIGDATIRDDNSTTNYGQDTQLKVGDADLGASGLQRARAVVNFDWTAIPPGSQIITATLSLTAFASSGSGNRTIGLSTLLEGFGENGVTWLDRSPIGTYAPWATAGAGSPGSRRTASTSVAVSNTTPTLYNVNVTSDVIKFVGGTYAGNGWVVYDETETADYERIFGSNEGAQSQRPILTIRYVPAAATEASWLGDGSFELSPLSSPWRSVNVGPGTRRVNENALGDFSNTGPAFCGDNYMTIDGAGIAQRFWWPGGTAYFNARLRAQNTSGAFVTIRALRTTGGGQVYPITFFDGFLNYSGQTWQQVQSSINMFSGYYDLTVQDTTGPADGQPDYQIDDVTIALNGYESLCGNILGGATITPFPSLTPTPTPSLSPTPSGTITPSASPSITPTPSPQVPGAFSNCNFEAGSAGWFGSGFKINLAGGPVGAQYAEVQASGNIYQPFAWTGGTVYSTFWVGPGSNGQIVARDSNTGASFTLWTGNVSSWQLLQKSLFLPPGNYVWEARPFSSLAMKVDGVMISRNGFAYCGSGNAAATQTPGPTSFVSPTPTRTPTTGPSPTPSPTNPQPSTRTPFPTNTPQSTYTPRPTDTQAATPTMNSAEQTATAQGTLVPTYTPYPTYTPFPTGTPVVGLPPQQPEPGCNADCIRPQSPLDLAGWIEYAQCHALTWVVWCDENTAEVLSWVDEFSTYEPFGTMRETYDALVMIQSIINSYDWENTGPQCGRGSLDLSQIFLPAYGILTGNFQFIPGDPIQRSCALPLRYVWGDYIADAACGSISVLCSHGMLVWIQYFFDFILLLLFIGYIQERWIAKATNS